MFSVIFPGQGSQFVGMGTDLYQKYEIVKKIFNQVDDKLGFFLSKIILNGSELDLKKTQNTQPAIMTVGVAIYNVLKKEHNIDLNKANFFAGHSLGEYTALVCANSLDLETAAYLLHERGKAMQEAVPVNEGGMLAVLGLATGDIEKLIKEIKFEGVCEVANVNCPGQIVISGDKRSLTELNLILKNNFKKSIFLPVSAPFHSSLMAQAANIMKEKIENAIFKSPKPSIISNVLGQPINDVNLIKELLIKQIFSKVRWQESIEFMIKNGVNNFIEIGPGKVLSGLVKRINKKVITKNINNLEDIKNYIKND